MNDAPKVADAGGIPEDLRLLHEASLEMLESQTFEGTAKQVIKLIKRIAALEAENRQLKEQVRKLSAPVSDEERTSFGWLIGGRYRFYSEGVDGLLRSRTQEPAQKEGK